MPANSRAYAPMALPLRRHTDVIREALAAAAAAPLAGRSVIEVGCGGGQLLAWLVRESAQAVGLEPDPAQLRRARALLPSAPLVQGVGEALPFASGRLDLVVYFNSLHHVPLASQWQAVAEAARVLARDGALLVVEPLPEGEFFALLRPLENETEIRREAYRALAAAAAVGLRPAHEAVYANRIVEPSWAATRARFLSANPARAAGLADVEPELERLFATLGEPAEEGGRAFAQPMRLNLLHRLP